MKIQITIKSRRRKDIWTEDYEKTRKQMINEFDLDESASDEELCEAWGKRLIEQFNSEENGRPFPMFRDVVNVTILDKSPSKKDHDWEKVNLITLEDKRGFTYDKMRCRTCGVTGRRNGIGGNVEYDKKYRFKVYARCDTAKAHLEKKEGA